MPCLLQLGYDDTFQSCVCFLQRLQSNPLYWIQDVSRLRHSPPIALTEEDPTGGELPIGEVTLQSRSAP